MAQLTIDQAAALGSQLTGIPVNFVKALIQAEGSWGGGNWTNGSIINNPFDVTAGWAGDVGYGGYVTGQGGSQGNIASFSDTTAAVNAWAAGINQFPLYAQFRNDLKGGGSVQTLATDLAKAGYAGPGNVLSWVNNLVTLTGNTLGSVAGGAVGGAVGGSGGTSGGAVAGGTVGGIVGATVGTIPSVPNPVTSVEQGLGSISTSLASGFQAETNLVNTLAGQGVNYVNAVFLVFERFLWILIGLVMVLAGLWVLIKSQELRVRTTT